MIIVNSEKSTTGLEKLQSFLQGKLFHKVLYKLHT